MRHLRSGSNWSDKAPHIEDFIVLTKIILWLSALALGLYGVACFFDAGLASGYAGFELLNDDARAEMIAMYGGVQIAIGVFCAIAIFNSQHQRSAVLLVALLFGGLALGRLFGLIQGSDTAGSYTYGALAYETFSFVLAVAALRSQKQVGAGSS